MYVFLCNTINWPYQSKHGPRLNTFSKHICTLSLGEVDLLFQASIARPAIKSQPSMAVMLNVNARFALFKLNKLTVKIELILRT